MSAATAEATATTSAEQDDLKNQPAAVEGQEPDETTTADLNKEAEAGTAAPAVEASAAADTARAAEGAKFMQAFGEQAGSVYFAKGMSFADAQWAHIQSLTKRLEVAELSLKQAGTAGEASALSVSTVPAKKVDGGKKPFTDPWFDKHRK
jgi:hypothetical protein